MLEVLNSKLNFMKKWLKQRGCAWICLLSLLYKIKPKNTANFDINWIMTNFLQLSVFFRVKNYFFCKKKKIRNMYVNIFRRIFFAWAIFWWNEVSIHHFRCCSVIKLNLWIRKFWTMLKGLLIKTKVLRIIKWSHCN